MSTFDPKALRTAFGRFMTGVTVVTARDRNDNMVGFTANSFTSVSLDPPMVLVCPGKYLSSFEAFSECTHFAVNILAEGQEDVSNIFAGYKGDRFARVPHLLDAAGVPLIEGALAQFSCTTENSLPAGDHNILLGQVTAFIQREGRGLGYSGGQYFSLGLERATSEHIAGPLTCGAIFEAGGKVLLQKTPTGYCPATVSVPNHASICSTLNAYLEPLGRRSKLGAAYSVFDDQLTRFVYFLATAEDFKPSEGLETVPIAELANLTYTTSSIATMMTRFATEAQTGDFALYLGDADRGEVHSLPERT